MSGKHDPKATYLALISIDPHMDTKILIRVGLLATEPRVDSKIGQAAAHSLFILTWE